MKTLFMNPLSYLSKEKQKCNFTICINELIFFEEAFIENEINGEELFSVKKKITKKIDII
jgi:hypothetical protein